VDDGCEGLIRADHVGVNPWEPELDRLAALNSGLILTRDLRALGFDDATIGSIGRRLTRVRHGAYVRQLPSDPVELHRLHARAVVLQHEAWVMSDSGGSRVPLADSGITLSHVSAAVFQGFSLSEVDLRTVHISGAPGRVRGGNRHWIHSHQVQFGADETCLVDDLAVTTRARTVVDVARVLPLEQALVMADQALRMRWVTAPELASAAERFGSRAGVSGLRRVIGLADGKAESPGETRTRLILVQAGLAVESQVDIHSGDGDFIGRVDLKLRDCAVVVEFDGRFKYAIDGEVERAHWLEKQRHDALMDAGFVVARIYWRDLSDPAVVLRRVHGAISRARRMGFAG